MTDPPVSDPLPADTAGSDTVFGRWRARRAGRVSKWDRPPAPKDWRYFVGGFGRVLITLGLLMFGFVIYQLWGTGIETARAQNRLEDQFEQAIEAPTETSTPATSATSATTVASTAPATTSTPTTEAGVSGEPIEPTSTSAPTTATPAPASSAPSATAAPSTVAPVADQQLPPIERGDVLAKLEIPKMGKQGGSALYVVPGVSVNDLKKGPGHYPDTPLPGQLGNAAIAGHRTTYGQPFHDIHQLEPGDEITVTMLSGDVFVYEVTSHEIVRPSDYHVVSDSDPTVATLTLTSCDPIGKATKRYVVHAVLKPQESAPVGEATYYDLEGGDIRDDADPSALASEESPSTTADPSTVAQPTSSTIADSASVADDSSLDNGFSTTPVADSTADDAFSQGWFHDSDAWPHIIIWGVLLAAIGYLSRLLSRRTRHDSIGIAAAALPFVFCLYFFYQNVNRLLPPGL